MGEKSEGFALSKSKTARNFFLGIVAAFLVPLFLSLAQSKIVSSITVNAFGKEITNDIMVYVGFCLIAAISFKRFLVSFPEQVLSSIEQKVEDAKVKIENFETDIDEFKENLGETSTLTVNYDQPEFSQQEVEENLKNLSPDEVAVLKAMKGSHYTQRTIGGLAKDLSVRPSIVSDAVDSLVKKGLVNNLVSRSSNNELYRINILGREVARRLLESESNI